MDNKIKELAIKAGAQYFKHADYWMTTDLDIHHFAELVAAAEREACIKLLEDFSKTDMVPVKDTWRMGLIAGANAIRARGDKYD